MHWKYARKFTMIWITKTIHSPRWRWDMLNAKCCPLEKQFNTLCSRGSHFKIFIRTNASDIISVRMLFVWNQLIPIVHFNIFFYKQTWNKYETNRNLKRFAVYLKSQKICSFFSCDVAIVYDIYMMTSFMIVTNTLPHCVKCGVGNKTNGATQNHELHVLLFQAFLSHNCPPRVG